MSRREVIGAARRAGMVRENRRHLGKLDKVVVRPYVGYAARGFLGQYLVVIPDEQLVAVRMARATPERRPGGFRGFERLVRELPAGAAPPAE